MRVSGRFPIINMARLIGLPDDASEAEVRCALGGGDPVGDRIEASLPALGQVSVDAPRARGGLWRPGTPRKMPT